MARGVDFSILFMLVVTYVVIGGGVAAFLALRIRARRNKTLTAEV